MKSLLNIGIILLTLNDFTAYAQSNSEKVKETLLKYKDALEKLDVTGTDILFAANSQIIESGKVEGTYQDYLAHISGLNWEISNHSNSKTIRWM